MGDHDSHYAAMHLACSQKDICGVGRLLRTFPLAQINQPNALGQTFLVQAIKYGCTAIVFQLLDVGGAHLDVCKQDEAGKSALFYACENNDDVVAMHLLARHADPNAQDMSGMTPLLVACEQGFLKIAKRLLDNPRVEIDHRECAGATALWMAAQKGHDVLVHLLLSQNADPNATDGQRKTPLLAAAEHGHLACVEALLPSTHDVNLPDKFGKTAIQYACEKNFGLTFQKLLSWNNTYTAARDPDERTLLMSACCVGNMDMVLLLLEHEHCPFPVHINAVDMYNRTALYYACEYPAIFSTLVRHGADPHHTDGAHQNVLMKAAEVGAVQVVKELLDLHVPLDDVDQNGYTALTYACIFGRREIVALLLDAGASALIATDRNRTPLMLAVSYGHGEIVNLMLAKRSADFVGMNYNDDLGETALTKACSMLDTPLAVLERLLEHGAIQIPAKDGETPLMKACDNGRADMVRLLLPHQHSPNVRGHVYKKTALYYACQRNSLDCVTLLLAHGADPTLPNSVGITPLMVASHAGELAIAVALLDPHHLHAQATLDDQDEEGRTALSYACAANHEDLVALLLRKGANSQKPCHQGFTPLMLATKAGNVGVQESLLGSGARSTIDAVDVYGDTALHHAVSRCDMKSIQVLLTNGASPRMQQSHTGATPLAEAVEAGSLEMVRLFLRYDDDDKAVVNLADHFARTPLHRAAAHTHTHIVDVLIDHGALVFPVDEDEVTPLMTACRRRRHATVLRLLRDATPDQVNMVQHQGFSALWYAISYQDVDMVERLRRCGADIQVLFKNQSIWKTGYPTHLNVDMLAVLVDTHGAELNLTDPQGRSVPYLLATSYGNKYKAMKYVLSRGANPWIRAPQHGRLPVEVAKSADMVEMLLDAMHEHERFQYLEKARALSSLPPPTKRVKYNHTHNARVSVLQECNDDILHAVVSHMIGNDMNDDVFGELFEMMKVAWDV